MTPNSGPSIEPLRKWCNGWKDNPDRVYAPTWLIFDALAAYDLLAAQRDMLSGLTSRQGIEIMGLLEDYAKLQREVESLRGELESLRANPKYRTPAEYDKQSRHLQQAHAALKKAKVVLEQVSHVIPTVEINDALTAIKECGL